MKRLLIQTLWLFAALFVGTATCVQGQTSSNTVKYKVTYASATQTYTVWAVPDYDVPNANNLGSTEKGATAQVTLIVPQNFTITNITDVKGTWEKDPLKLGPGQPGQTWTGLNPDLNYYTIGKTTTESDYGAFKKNQDVALFTFKGSACVGTVKILPNNDPFVNAADQTYSLAVACSFYSRSGQPSGGNQTPLEQFISVSGDGANCGNVLVLNPDAPTTTGTNPVTIDVLGNDTFNGQKTDPDKVTITVDTPPKKGKVIIKSNGQLEYTPDPGTSGSDCFTYKVCEKASASNCGTAEVCVDIKLATTPTKKIFAYNDANVTTSGQATTGNVLSNDDLATGTAPLMVNTTPVTNPSNGTVTLLANGNYTYTPAAGFTGTDSFKYSVCDASTTPICSQVTVTIAVMPAPSSGGGNGGGGTTTTNKAPVALSDIAATKSGTSVSGNVLSNDIDPDAGQTLTASVVTNPSFGTVTLNPNGTYTYIPGSGFVGTDVFVYKACDNGTPQQCSQAVVMINAYDANTTNLPPVANADLAKRTGTQPAVGNVLANDRDPEGGSLILNTTPVVPPTGGTLVLNPDGSFIYTPAAGFTGNDRFTYEVCDNANPKACSRAVVYMVVTQTATGNTDLKITTKIEGDKIRTINEVVTFTVTVKNLGPTTATNIVVKDSTSTGLILQSGSASAGSYTAPLWVIPSLAVGDSVKLTLTAKVVAEGVNFNFAQIVSLDQTDTYLPNNDDNGCVSVPIAICLGQVFSPAVPAQYTNVAWFKDGKYVAAGNNYNITGPGTYTFTATNATCPTYGCCPIVVVEGNCCPTTVCIPFVIRKTK